MAHPSTEQVWDWLDQVPPDPPEIPVISLVDLGIIRDVAWQGDHLDVTVTPTYSAAPPPRPRSIRISWQASPSTG